MTRTRRLPWHLALLCEGSRRVVWELAEKKHIRVRICGRTAFWYD